jgi:GNAT superfamily N-acetyltransferase
LIIGNKNLTLEEPAMDIQIRRAVAADAASIADLLHEIGFFERINHEAPEETRERVSRHLALCLADDSHSIYVAEDEAGGVAGYAAVHWLPYFILAGPEGYVSELFLCETARGQGTGARLLEAVKDEARERGCSRLDLINSKQRESYQRGFYAKHGWEERPDMANFIYRMERG